MNYTEFKDAVKETTENTFTDVQLANFFRQVEERLYTVVEVPVTRKNETSLVTLGSPYITLPADYLNTYSLAVEDTSGKSNFLLQKEVAFIREAYPDSATFGLPAHYAQFDQDTFIIGPSPDAYYPIELHYHARPESIVTAGTTWLGDNYESALLNGALVEAARFMKEEADVVAAYQKSYEESLMIYSSYGANKVKTDEYRR